MVSISQNLHTPEPQIVVPPVNQPKVTTLPEKLQVIANYVRSIALEIFVTLLLVVTAPAILFESDPKPSETPLGSRPILLVHGYCGNSATWIYQKYRLKKAGFQVYTVNLGSPFHSIEHYAKKVQKKAEQIAKDTKRNDLSLVGHSMGGLVSSYYATTLAQEGSVTDVVTLGSPLRGTKVANIGFGKCAKQMRYKSTFTQNLAKKIDQATNIRFYHMKSRVDLVIRPTKSAVPKHAKGKKHVFNDMGHVSYLFSSRVSNNLIDHFNNTAVAV